MNVIENLKKWLNKERHEEALASLTTEEKMAFMCMGASQAYESVLKKIEELEENYTEEK